MRSNKHHTYHRLPGDNIMEHRRYKEEERFDFLKKSLNFRHQTVLDVGCNTGFFLTKYLAAGAKRVIAFEGSKICHPILTQHFMTLDKRLNVNLKYYDFDASTNGTVDIFILLNVLHHIGDDFGDSNLSKSEAKERILSYINKISGYSQFLVFQMGFNWKANVNDCLFPNGTKAEMLNFISTGTKSHWDIKSIGIPVGTKKEISYQTPDEQNIGRLDHLGEFLNRPIFILQSRNAKFA